MDGFRRDIRGIEGPSTSHRYLSVALMFVERSYNRVATSCGVINV